MTYNKYVKDDKQVLDYVILKIGLKNLIEEKEYLNKFDFFKEYNKESNQSYVKIATLCAWDSELLHKKFPNLIFPKRIGQYIGQNIFFYLLLKSAKEINNVGDFIYQELKNNNNEKIKFELHIIRKYFKSEFESEKLLLFFPALKTFYSEETKHLYSKELLKEMKEYEEEIILFLSFSVVFKQNQTAYK
ncbi:MAG: hypothetical protein KAS15_04935 [Nanoarchaeota archaeon]|nr:hypothetical protein [Nanoarchaeota archaeon]